MKNLLLTATLAFITMTGLAQSDKSATTFGEAFESDISISADELRAKLKNQKSFQGLLSGKVNSVCQVKGCWMKLNASAGEDIMVQFKDYKFFVPKDIDGKVVLLNGVGRNNQITVETLRHYAKDAGKTEEEISRITEPENQIVFVASGVRIIDK